MDNVTVNGKDITELIPNEVIKQQLYDDSVEFGLNFGAGILFQLGIIDMLFQAQYNLDLTDLNDETPDEGIQ